MYMIARPAQPQIALDLADTLETLGGARGQDGAGTRQASPEGTVADPSARDLGGISPHDEPNEQPHRAR
jgi:hypothetical protein